MMSETVEQELPGLQSNDHESLIIDGTDVIIGRKFVRVPLPGEPTTNSDKGTKGQSGEHSYIGDAIVLTLDGDKKVLAKEHPFILENKLSVTYGQINALAGDFYGTKNPISDGADAKEQSIRFIEAYDTLAGKRFLQPTEARTILRILQTEIDFVKKAVSDKEDPSVGLALINWDHFGEDARTAYNAGHGEALKVAASGNLERAYALNAFADHFLEDSFSAGHLRTPRRGLYENKDLWRNGCAKYMHDEDNAIGLSVKNSRGESWNCYGDKRMLDKAGAKNLENCIAAVQASADEIYTAYKTRTVLSPSSYNAWTIAPTLESARDPSQELAPLFKYRDNTKHVDCRRDITNRREHDFASDWDPEDMLRRCEESGWWKYPITIDGPPRIIPEVSEWNA
ncbi:hypothetical protein RSOLAG22IIIB_07821 [Rhizoctonia solani]|uniref:Uncharacterized protein n=1 Tax=Rhizoctonia solani TaxID=456999 RepID=A0A0K6FQ18_9AGAM|nr:hypothetical protein RSOLAG22IIIB_07821 [Rhizoctonia solani]